jgi:hypothetical protein
MLDRVRRVASALVAFALISPSLAASAAEGANAPGVAPGATPSLTEPAVARRGVAVIAIGAGAADAAWPVALAVYGDEALRPRLQDRDARVLAGAEPAKDAPKETRELAELRAQVRGDDAASRLLLKEIARRTATVALVLVWPKGDALEAPAPAPVPVQARLYDAADDAVDPTLHREGTAGWSALVTTLRGRYVKPEGGTTTATGTPADAKGELPKAPPAKGGSTVLSSPWFWGAIAAAVLGAVVLAASSAKGSDTSAANGLRIEWGK